MTHIQPAEGEPIIYQVRLPLSTKSLTLVTTTIRKHRQRIRSRWRKLADGQIAVIVLAALRHDQRPADLAAAHGISHHTIRRWIRETITLLARQAPRLDRVLRHHARTGGDLLLLDGTCIPVTRPHRHRDKTRDRSLYCGKHRCHHLRALTLTTTHGRLLWISAPTGARTHEATQAKRLRLPARLRHHTLTLITDRAHTRLDDDPTHHPTVIHGRRANRHHKLTPEEKTLNHLIDTERASNEHAHAHLKNWRILTRLRPGWTHHTTTLLRALLVLTNTEINR